MTAISFDSIMPLIERHWGIRKLRPLQEPAIRAALDRRDSLVVLPTGGGKSLCYQVPSLVKNDLTVVVSPLISLMKDQVDGLRECGVPAVQIDSTLTDSQRRQHADEIRRGAVRLAFVSPERLAMPSFQDFLQQAGVARFAIDEAHCISHWGHDFRPEYRQLNLLKTRFPDASVHAFTATATERVRHDIIAQLKLKSPEVLVGDFDRPNLTYRVVPRERDFVRQVHDVIARHKGEGGIVYCIRRRDVDDLASCLLGSGIRARPYHAGLSADQRKEAQEAFINEQVDVIVATVAFGMGIDRSNVRFVLHAAMPKSIEHYQQESGRAGRDGLEAECVLLFGAGDFMTWKRIIEKSAAEATEPVDPAYVPNALRHVDDMVKYCRTAGCRHKALVEYFGQKWTNSGCGACDRCLEGFDAVPDSQVIAQKILSCVARVQESFGIQHVVDVLRGSANAKVLKNGHEKLSTHGLLRDESESQIRDWIHQLIDRESLWQEQKDQYSILRLNAASWEVMKGSRLVRLTRTAKLDRVRKSRSEAASWEGVDPGLFEELRQLRRSLADAQSVPPYVVFSDATLRELTRRRPSNLAQMRQVHGVGESKLNSYGAVFLERIAEYCRDHSLPLDVAEQPIIEAPFAGPSMNARRAFPVFSAGGSIEDAMKLTGMSRSTVIGYLCEYIQSEKPASLSPWIDESRIGQIAAAVQQHGTERLRPIFLALQEKVSYDEIRIVVAHMKAQKKTV
jgi:ATP-dependent DNA helicase RecQ